MKETKWNRNTEPIITRKKSNKLLMNKKKKVCAR